MENFCEKNILKKMAKNLDGENWWKIADKNLADFAVKNFSSAGRKFAEIADPDRLPFQRDRDRILHAKSFRRLCGKMQVLPPNSGDHFRNRMTHTLEVSQIARDTARQLFLNEDLAEAIALAHDLGHPPFGHAGEKILNQKMQKFGKNFEHNLQSLRVVEILESREKNFPGLNLCAETLDGMKKHAPNFFPNLESQIVDVADEIAYLAADLDDGVRGNFFSIAKLKKLKIPFRAISEIPSFEKSAVVRRIIKIFIQKLIFSAKKNLAKFKIKNLADVQNCGQKIIFFEKNFFADFLELKNFLRENFYFSKKVRKHAENGQKIIAEIFDFLEKNPEKFLKIAKNSLEKIQQICDFIAGMTDNFAKNFWRKNVKKKI